MSLSGGGRKRFFFSLFLLMLVLALFLRRQALDESMPLRFYDRVVILLTHPVVKVLRATSDKTRSVVSRYFFLVGVDRENEALRQENTRLKEEAVLHRNLDAENARLRKVLELPERSMEPAVVASVISFPPTGPYRILTIDKGSKAGVRKAAPVISAEGLVGQVVRVFSNVSQVLLITDPTSAVDAQIENTGSRGLVVGKSMRLDFQHEIFLGAFEYLNKAAAIEEGAAIVTSGMDGVYPAGILVGHAKLEEKKKYDIFQEAEVVPAVDFYRLREVVVLR